MDQSLLFKKVVDLKGESSNRLFDTLADWNATLEDASIEFEPLP